MPEIDLGSIDVSGRFRRHMGDIPKLAESIDKIDLLHPGQLHCKSPNTSRYP
jgi:hypothetical protein